MPVAKSYANMEIQGEPFKEKGYLYVNVRAKAGIKKVRWYSDAEYQRMYPQENKHDIMDFNARHAFGFDDLGYITLYKGDEAVLEAFVEEHHESFRYNLIFKYYTPSRLTVPDLPIGILPIRLSWESIMAHDDRMKPHEEVEKYVNSLLIPDDGCQSRFQGAKNEWLQKTVTIKEKKTNETHFGTKHTYTLEDAENNLYVWETGAKDYPCDKTVSLKMKVKEHKEINHKQITVVWYCKEV